MTLVQRKRHLDEVRGAIRGWAFAPTHWVARMIERAEQLRDSMPEEIRAEADELIQPLREEVAEIRGEQ